MIPVLSWDSWYNERGLIPDNLHPIISVSCTKVTQTIRVTGSELYDGVYVLRQQDLIERPQGGLFVILRQVRWRGYPHRNGVITLENTIEQKKNDLTWENVGARGYLMEVYSNYNLRSRNVPFVDGNVACPPTFPSLGSILPFNR